MDKIYRYNPNVFYKANEGRYLQFMSAKDLYIQNISISEHDNHSDSCQVRFPNVLIYIPYKLCTSLLMILKMKSPLMTQLIIEMEIKSRTDSCSLRFEFL